MVGDRGGGGHPCPVEEEGLGRRHRTGLLAVVS